MKKYTQHRFFFAILLMVITSACSTKKNTLINRSYHELTSYYNVYFNGNEALKSGLLKVETQIEDDYTHILPFYKESVPQAGELLSSDMDIAIEKATKLIKMHSITKPPKNKGGSGRNRKAIKNEYNRFVDDAYMLMGRSYLYKKDFYRAHATFSLVIKDYKDDPVKYNASLWLLRTLSESGRFAEAGELITTLEKDKEFPKELEGELAIATADYNIRQNRYEEAISLLNIGIKKIKGNKQKTRLTFILAQLYQETNKTDYALSAYRQVVRRRPNYKMMFNARINSAKVLSGEGNTAELKKELNRMSRQMKNKPYLDQIFYALGTIYQSEGKPDDAIRYFQQSVANSSVNIHQRALSSITLANIFFDRKAYIPSGLYFDSAMVIIDENYPNYENISRQYQSLSRLVNNLKMVEREDSLQKVALMDVTERNALINNIITDLKNKEEELLATNAEGQYQSARYRGVNRMNNMGGSNSSSWYFYNPSTIAYGKKDFQRIWGERTLEDNWRRSNKAEVLESESDETNEADASKMAEKIKETRLDDPTKPEFYLQDLPLNDSLMALSHKRIRDALFDAGTLFKNEYSAFPQSVGCFRGLDQRYPDNIYKLSSYFNLWDLYKQTGNQDSSNYFKNWIIERFPQSNYARFLVNPNYFIELEARKDSINRMYQSVFNAYKNRDYQNAALLAIQTASLKPDSAMVPKLQFIRMVSQSRLLPAAQFSDSIDLYINKYPNAEPVELAKQIKKMLAENKLSNYQEMVKSGYLNEFVRNQELLGQKAGTLDESASKWDTNSDLLHYFIIAFPTDSSISLNRLKFDLANYNLDHYTSRDFEIETENLNNEVQMIVVRNLDNKESAMIYFLSIIRKSDVFRTLAGSEYLNFIISNNNFRQMLSDRSYNDYLAYFVKNYSNLTKGGFTEEELESPEALMARSAKAEEVPEEKGEYVVVETANVPYTPEAPKDQLFKLDYNQSHSLAVYIKQKGYRTGLIMRSFVQYNANVYRDKRLRVTPAMAPEGIILLVTPFPNAYEARNYLVDIQDRKDLFQSLGEIPYSTFIISNENLAKLQETGKVQEYEEFHLKNYIKKRPPNPADEIKPKNKPINQNIKVPTSVKTPASDQKPVAVADTISVPARSAAPVMDSLAANPSQKPADEKALPGTNVVESEKTEPKDTTANAVQPKTTEKPDRSKSPEKTDSLQVQTISAETTIPAGSKFIFEPDSAHQVFYLLPNQGFNTTLLITYLKRFNATKPGNQNLVIETIPFSDTQIMLVIGLFDKKESAISYLNGISSDQRINLSVRNVKHRVLAISKKNMATLCGIKDAEEYIRFFEQNYK